VKHESATTDATGLGFNQSQDHLNRNPVASEEALSSFTTMARKWRPKKVVNQPRLPLPTNFF